jgi:serine phosphatase RsbU (regulator of sigma subunit)
VSPENSHGSSAPTDQAPTTGVSRDVRDEVVALCDDVGLYLVVIEGRDTGRWIELGRAPVTGGRDSHLDLVIADHGASRLHILVSVIDGTVVVEDLGSTNGTFVDGQRIVTRAPLPVGSVLRVGDHVLRCERCNRREVERAKQQQRDLERATAYVLSLLPPPSVDGPLRTEWLFLPSARLGGDALGYEQLDPQSFVIYLIDVSGHGVGAAMHSVSVLNVLRQRALSHADFKDPVQVLTSLNAMFQMDRHDDQCFTMWYGVYDTVDRTLTYASAGHHPGYLVPPTRLAALPLRTSGPIMGAKADAHFRAQVTSVPVGSSLYLFSDGAFEILTNDRQWRLEDFLPLLLEPPSSGIGECRRIYQAVRSVARFGQLEDDFSLLVVTFP